MRILFFHRWVGVRKGGAETHIKELAKRFAKAGHEIDFLTLEGVELNGIPGISRIYGILPSPGESLHSYTDWRVYLYTLFFMLKSALKLLAFKFRRINYDVVSVHFATEAIVMRWLKSFLGWPCVYVCEGYSDLEAKVARFSDIQLAISRHIIDNYYQRFGYKPKLLHVGVDTHRFAMAGDKTNIRRRILGKGFADKFIVLTVCRIFPDKDLPTLIRAAKIVHQKNPGVVFLVVGDGPERPLVEKMALEFDLGKTVIFTGGVSDALLPEYYRLSDMFVLTEMRSGFSGGIVFLEAMSAGLPIVASDAGGTSETLEGCGIIFPIRDAEKLAENILRLFNDRSLYQKMQAQGSEKVKAYDWDNLIPKYLQEYESVASKERR